jgi:WD40-like Beta Propeller Repeat
MRIKLLLAVAVLAYVPAFSQSSTVLDNNPNLKWKQVKTPNFKVIFPAGFETQAMRMANTFEHIRIPESKTLGGPPRKVSIILQNQSAISNGFVSFTPRRSEFFAMPSQNYNFQGNLDWLDLLATHEYRHIVQFNQANRGFNRVLYYLFGANTLAAMSYVAVPQWFWEGDAVLTETEFTKSGRGRIPNFDLLFRTNLQEGRTFNYNKQYLRSYKHNIPDHYVLGYHMVNYLRKRTGSEESWDNITRRAWSVPFFPFTFSSAIKKESGLYVKDLYAEMARDLQKEWEANQQGIQPSSFEKIHQRKSQAYTDYEFPQAIGTDSIVAIKSGIGDVEELVLLTTAGEQKLLTLGPYNQTGMLSANSGRVVWNEYRFDPRWRVKTYSVIVAYDLKTNLRKQITFKSRYASAALSPDGTQVATVETGTDYQTNLVILDYETGTVIKTFENPDNDFISMPRWSKSGKEIIALATNRKGKALVEFAVESGIQESLTDPSTDNIGHPHPTNDYIFYNAPINGIDNIFAWDVGTGFRFQVTQSRFGAYNPTVSSDGKYIYYNEQGRDGFDIVRTTIDKANWIWRSSQQVEALAMKEGNDLLADVPQEEFEIKNYSRATHLFNPYSWGAYADNTLTQVDIGITSRDVLSTMSLNAGYLFDINERTGSWKAGLSYQGAYPILDVNVSSANRSLNEGNISYETIVSNDTVTTSGNLTYKWAEKNLEAGLRLPLLATSSRFLSLITIGNYVGVTKVEDFTNSITGSGRLITPQLPQYWIRSVPGNGRLLYNHFFMTGYRYQRQSRRDINPKWGQSFVAHGYGTPYGGDYTGNQFSFYGSLYFPGLFKHQSLWGYWGYQKTKFDLLSRNSNTVSFEDNGSYIFRNQIPLPRGQSISRFENFYSMSVNYTSPVWYPDLNIGPLLNLQRIRVNAFLDYGFGSSVIGENTISQSYLSIGNEVKFDINILRMLPQLDLGFRYSYGISPATTRFELLIGTLNF